MNCYNEPQFEFEIPEDPNEPDEHRNGFGRIPLYKSSSIDQLKTKLEEEDDCFECIIKRKHWSRGEAVVNKVKRSVKNCEISVIQLPSFKSCGRAFDGDVVVVKINDSSAKRDGTEPVYGEVEGILERKENLYEKKFLCRVVENSSSYMIPIDDNAIRFYIMSPRYHKFKSNKVYLYQESEKQNGFLSLKQKKSGPVNADHHDTHRIESKLFVVRYINWSKNHPHPYGYVEDVINQPDSFTKHKITCRVHEEHTEKVRRDAKMLIKQSKQRCKGFNRLDLTDLYVFTIDDTNSKILDDAFSIERCVKHKNCWKIGIHVADVASVVPEGSEVDFEAEKRGMSFIDSTGTAGLSGDEGHMFPKELSMYCSLSENEERLAVSTFFHSTKPLESSCNNSVLSKIQSKKKLSYQMAQNLLNEYTCGKSNLNESLKLAEMLHNLWRVMWTFRVHRLDTGAIYYSEQDAETLQQECMAHILVEEAMITLNAFIAQFFKANKVPFLARTQPPPHPNAKWMFSSLSLYQMSCLNYYKEKYVTTVDQQVEKEHGSRMVVSKEIWSKISWLIQNGNVEEAIFCACCDDLHPELIAALDQYIHVQNVAEGKYCSAIELNRNEAEFIHFSLRVALYLRCSSPIRRYEDLVAQRSLVAVLKDSHSSFPVWVTTDIEKNKEIEQRVIQFRKVIKQENFFQKFKPTYFEAYVVMVNDFSITVHFPSLGIQPQIPISYLGPTKQNFTENTVQGNALQLEWTVRYYDIPTQQKFLGKHHKKQTEQNFMMSSQFTVSTNKWKGFLDSLCRNYNLNGDVQEVADALQRVAGSVAPKNDYISPYERLNPTSNGIVHGRKIELEVKPSVEQSPTTPLYFQLAVGLEQSMNSLVPQLFYLTPSVENSSNSQCENNLEICLWHRQHVTMFDINYGTPEDDKVLKEFERISKKLYLYYREWISLVRMDGVYSSVRSNNSILIQLEDVASGQFSLGNFFCDVCFITIQKGDFICLRKKTRLGKTNKFNTWVGHGVITKVKKNKNQETSLITFQIFKSPTGDMPRQYGPITCEVIPLSVSHRRMENALFALSEANTLLNNICIGNNFSSGFCQDFRISIVVQQLKVGKVVLGELQNKLNKKQTEQVNKALQNQVTLIQGPPGTGKSFMGAHLAYYFCQLNKRLSKKGKILYCGPSNKSVDVVAGYLQKIPSLSVARVYGSMLEELDFPIPIKPDSHSSDLVPINPSLYSVTLHHIIRQDGKPFAAELKKFDDKFQTRPAEIGIKDYNEYKEILTEAKECELNRVDVILCTCVVAGSKLLSKLRYAQCIIDECGMCSEPESLIPIVTATKRDNFDDEDDDDCDLQVTLIGDHKQLQPIVTCQAAGKGGLEKSMFERLQSKAEKLTTQYRMHETISQFPSKQFYDNELVTDVSVKSRKSGVLRFPLSNENNTAVFCHVSGWEEEDESKSKFNLDQVTAVTKVLSYLLIKNSVKPTEIMVLSPYLAQCREMKKAVKNHKTLKRFYDQLHIGSVATSQGSEADYVILSTVRSCCVSVSQFAADRPWLYKNIGFVTDNHQINVALTRAKLGLCVIGNADLLVMDPTWKSLIHGYKKRGAVMNLQRERYHIVRDFEDVLGLESTSQTQKSEDDYEYLYNEYSDESSSEHSNDVSSECSDEYD